MNLLQFTLREPPIDRHDEPVAINPAFVCRLNPEYDRDGSRTGTVIWLVADTIVVVSDSYETVLDALQAVEGGRA